MHVEALMQLTLVEKQSAFIPDLQKLHLPKEADRLYSNSDYEAIMRIAMGLKGSKIWWHWREENEWKIQWQE